MYSWTIYPSSSRSPMIATGATDDGDQARKAVECILAICEPHSFGLVIENGLRHEVCRRTSHGYAWREIFTMTSYDLSKVQ